MNMRQLRYFLAVAQELNFTRAAERVKIAQPPLSQQIMALEAELGTPLFTRENRRVELTPAGEILVEHAHRVLNAAEAAEIAVRAATRGASTSISIASIYSGLYAFLPPTLHLFSENEPDAHVRLQEMTIAQQISALKEGEIEVGLLRGHMHETDLVSEQLYREHLIVAVPAGSPYASDEPVTVEELSTWPLISVERSNTRGYADRLLSIFENADQVPNIVNEVRDMHTSICLVGAGMGVSIVPTIIKLLSPHGIKYRQIKDSEAYVTFSLAWRRDLKLTSPITSFLEAARTHARNQIANNPGLFSEI